MALKAVASSGGVPVGGTVTGGTNNSVLFVNPAGVLAQDNPNFTYTVGTGTLATPNLAVSTAISGAGFTAFMASPPPIGSTAANTGSFTVLTITTAGAGSITNAGNLLIASTGGDIAFGPNNASKYGWAFRSGSANLNGSSDSAIQWTNTAATANNTSGPDGTVDLALLRDAANVLALKNAANAQTARIYGTTTGPKYLSLSHDGTNGVIDVAAASGLLSIAPTNATSVSIGKKVSSYNGQATAGIGAVIVVAAPRQTGLVAAQSLAAFTVGAADGSFEVSANVLVTTATTHNFTVTCAYTDEGNTARTITFSFEQLAGSLTTAIVNTNGAVPYEGVPLHIRAKATTTITIASAAGGTYTSVVYNLEGIIKQTA